MKLDAVTDGVLSKIDDLGFKQEGAFNLRYNGQPLCHGDTEHIKIRRKDCLLYTSLTRSRLERQVYGICSNPVQRSILRRC